MSVYVILVLVIVIVLFILYVYTQWKIKNNEKYLGYICAAKDGGDFENPHQQDDIYNISSRVQGQDQWPTHDAYLSIEHITTTNQLNKPNYNDAPPSYEEVMKIAASNSGSSSTVPTVVVVPKSTD